MRAEVAELADAHGSGPCTRKGVGVRVPSSAPKYLYKFDRHVALHFLCAELHPLVRFGNLILGLKTPKAKPELPCPFGGVCKVAAP